MENYVSVGPHIKGNSEPNKAYIMMAISLVPALITGVVVFGFRSLLVALVCIASAFVAEIVYNFCRYKKFVFYDYSTILVGALSALMMPAGVPLLAPVLGVVLANIFVKNCMGGRGSSIVSEAAFAKVLTFAAFAGVSGCYIDAVSGVATSTTALDMVLNGNTADFTIVGMLFGNVTGAIGETAVLLLFIAGVTLCILKVIDYKVPVMYLVSVLVLSMLIFGVLDALYLMLSGGVMLVAFYLLTDYSTNPKTLVEKTVYSVGAALITVLYWRFGRFPSLGGLCAVLVMGILSSAFKGYYIPKCSREKK